MFWLQIVSNFLKILRAGQSPNQIAGGFAIGAVLGISPILTLQGLFLWLVVFTLDVNLSAALLAFSLFSLVAYLSDPLFHSLGFYLLVDAESLRGLWTALYNMSVAPLTRFYNTVVLGSFISGVVLFGPIFWGIRRFVAAYRARIHSTVERWKIYQVASNSSLVKWYMRIRDLGVV